MLEVVDHQQCWLAGEPGADRLDCDLGDAKRAGDGVEHILRLANTRQRHPPRSPTPSGGGLGDG
jgi:hypothetical protein